MALPSPVEAVDISAALTQLEPLGTDEYFVAFGSSGRQFCGTPNGYSAAQLPPNVVTDLLDGKFKQVKWASFGGDHLNSYFIAYKMLDGSPAYRVGKAVPSTLRPFLNNAQASPEIASNLRVQLGSNRSWIAWAGSLWACRKVPSALEASLCQLSSEHCEDENGSRGTLKTGSITNVAWHESGSYYVRSGEHIWNFESASIRLGWDTLWDGLKHTLQDEPTDLAYVAIDPHSPTGDSFAFIMKKQLDREPDFVVRFEPEDMVSRLPPSKDESVKPIEPFKENRSAQSATTRLYTDAESPRLDMEVAKRPAGPRVYLWAVSKRAGRSHATDSWELDLKKGQRVKVLEEKGRDWFIVQDMHGLMGYAHGSRLDFMELRAHVNPQEAYTRWVVDTERWLQLGAVRTFLRLSSYMDACTRDVCRPLKREAVGICAHDLQELLRGSGQYSMEFLKTQRNRYHPDKFARYCHPEHKDELKTQAEALFVLFGVLMDWMANPPEDGNIG